MRTLTHCRRTLALVVAGILGMAAPGLAQRPPGAPFRVGSDYLILFPSYLGTFRVLAPPDANGMMSVQLLSSQAGLEQLIAAGPIPLWVNTRQAVLVQEAVGQAFMPAAGGTRGGAPQASPAGNAALAAVRSDLRNLVTAQEVYFADNVTYTSELQRLRYRASPGVTVRILSAMGTGWAATAVHASAPGYVCGIFVGSATPPVSGQNEGEPSCVRQ